MDENLLKNTVLGDLVILTEKCNSGYCVVIKNRTNGHILNSLFYPIEWF